MAEMIIWLISIYVMTYLIANLFDSVTFINGVSRCLVIGSIIALSFTISFIFYEYFNKIYIREILNQNTEIEEIDLSRGLTWLNLPISLLIIGLLMKIVIAQKKENS